MNILFRGFLGNLLSLWFLNPLALKASERFSLDSFQSAFPEAYTVSEVLGQGSFGIVIKAERAGRPYAVKCHLIRDGYEGYKTELDIFAKLPKHGNILLGSSHSFEIALVEKGDEENRSSPIQAICIETEAMDFDLQRIQYTRDIRDTLRFWKITKQIFKQVLLGVSHLHSFGILHRDLKLHNIFASHNPSYPHRSDEIYLVKLGDFGSAKCIRRSEIKRYGTPSFGAPETALSREEVEVTHRLDFPKATDMWASGALLIHFLSGINPFDGGTDRSRWVEIIRAKQASTKLLFEHTWAHDTILNYFDVPLVPEISEDDRNNLVELIRGLLAEKPEERWNVQMALESKWLEAV